MFRTFAERRVSGEMVNATGVPSNKAGIRFLRLYAEVDRLVLCRTTSMLMGHTGCMRLLHPKSLGASSNGNLFKLAVHHS